MHLVGQTGEGEGQDYLVRIIRTVDRSATFTGI